jgi:Tfp pilus assembly protein PilN
MMNEDLKSLCTIDFLPQRYREAKINRSASAWRVVCVFLLAGLLLTASYFQSQHLRQAREDLARVDVLYAQAQAQAKAIAASQVKNAPATHEAELLTYLRHPWPRTQILNAILATAPESVFLNSLELRFDVPERAVAERGPETTAPPLKGPQRDLKELRDRLDGGRWSVSLRGTAEDTADLHSYIAGLEQQPLFSKVQLLSIETHESASSTECEFSAQITIRPGYGQPGGPEPTKLDEASVAGVGR